MKTLTIWTKDETSQQISKAIKGYDVPISQVTSLQDTIDTINSRIDGQSKAHVFDDTTSMKNWLLKESGEVGKVGDDVYTTWDGDDYWIAAVSTSPEYTVEIEGNPYESYYKLIASQGETVDLSGYVNSLTGTATNGVLTGLTKSGKVLTVSSTNLTTTINPVDGYYISGLKQASNGKIEVSTAALPTCANQTIGVGTTTFSNDALVKIAGSGKVSVTAGSNLITIGCDLSGKQDSLTSTQLSACNSGITSSLVSQITTNKNSIATNTSSISTTNTNLTSVTSRVTTLENNQVKISVADGLTTGGVVTINYNV